MWAKFKALPLFAKVLIGFLVLAGIYQMGQTERNGHQRRQSFSSAGNDAARYDEVGDEQAQPNGSNGLSGSSGSEAALAQFQSQQAQLMSRVRQCQGEMTQATNAMARAAMQGGMVNNRPACEQYMPQWVAQEAYLETEIYRIQTGDHSSSLRQITGIAAPVADSGRPTGQTGLNRSGDGTEAVDRWDRESIRGNSLYTDEGGQQHELPTRSYYFRDRASGQIVGSDQPNPPNNSQDFEQLNYQPN